jgi:predicted pyridoxine 5'-phosphate oxidase superfamily flavin-nucleotide-binding protein
VSADDDPSPSPFHAGELAVQERCGVREPIARVGRAVIRPFMLPDHQELFARLPMLLVGSLDAGRRPWASVLVGRRRFTHAIDDRTLRVGALPTPGDPLEGNLALGAPLGILGIELATRRRNRLNGTVTALDDDGFTVGVDQSFGNCPQYIQARSEDWRRPAASFRAEHVVTPCGARLTDESRALVERADTLFLASAAVAARGHAGADGVDVSHRGGKPGFVKVRRAADNGADELVLPDFRGNFLFNSLGNITAYPRAGLLIPDFASGDLVQLTGRAAIVWDGDELASFAGAERLVLITLDVGVHHRDVLPFTWSEPELARQLVHTGSWPA